MSRGIIALSAWTRATSCSPPRLTNGDELHFPGLARGQGDPLQRRETSARWAGRRAACAAWICAEGDYLVGAEVVEKEGLILSISENGYGKRTPLEDYRLTARGGKGVINMKTTPQDRQGGGAFSRSRKTPS